MALIWSSEKSFHTPQTRLSNSASASSGRSRSIRNSARCHQLWVYMKELQSSHVSLTDCRNATPSTSRPRASRQCASAWCAHGILALHLDRLAGMRLGLVDPIALLQAEGIHAPDDSDCRWLAANRMLADPQQCLGIAAIEGMELAELAGEQVARPFGDDVLVDREARSRVAGEPGVGAWRSRPSRAHGAGGGHLAWRDMVFGAESRRPSGEFIDSTRLAAITGSRAQRSSLSAAAMKRSKRLPKTSHSSRSKSSASMASASALRLPAPDRPVPPDPLVALARLSIKWNRSRFHLIGNALRQASRPPVYPVRLIPAGPDMH